MSSRFSLEGPVALVIGAASGLSRAIALGLAEAGSHVACLDRDEAGIAEVMAEIGSAASAHQVDQLGRIDIAVNSAGIGGRSPAVEYPEEMWDAVLAVNMTGTFNVCRSVARHMVSARSGSIVNIVSIGGVAGYPGSVGYQASKGGVVQMTRTLAMEWAEHDVRVNAVALLNSRPSLSSPSGKRSAGCGPSSKPALPRVESASPRR